MIVDVVVMLVLLVFVMTARSGAGHGAKQGLGTAVRRFFQFGLQFGLVCVVAVGLSSLIARPLQPAVLAAANQADLARGLSFTIVGIPLLWGIARWTRRRMAEDAREALSLGWSFYLAVAELTSLAIAAFALQDVIMWAARAGEYDAGAISRVVVWGAVWWVHRRLTRVTTAEGILRDHELAGAAIGLWLAGMGMADLLATIIHSFTPFASTELVASPDHPVMRATAGVVVGAGIWTIYWLRKAQTAARTLHWQAYVLLAGVGAGLVVAIVSASIVLYQTLVWFLGVPDSPDAATHFSGSMDATGAFVAGAVIWWYHRSVLAEGRAERRDEARRVYEYLMAFVALMAAAAGCMILLVAMLEAVTAAVQVAGPGAGNTLLLAATLLLVGTPIWWWFWRGIEGAKRTQPAAEVASPSRRVYLFLLFGMVGVAAVIAMLVAVYLLFDDLVSGRLGLATLRGMRWGLGIVVTAAIVAQFHWRMYRGERTLGADEQRGPRFVLLVGPPDASIADAVAARTHGRVQAWAGVDVHGTWSVDAVMSALEGSPAEELVVVAEAAGLRAIPIRR